MIISSKSINLDSTLKEMAQLAKAMPDSVARGAYGFAEQVMTESKKRVPVDTGALKSSGHVSVPKVKGTKAEIELGYGGPAGAGNHGGESNAEDVGYGFRVHEDLTAHHTVGEAKFLEKPLDEAMPQLGEQIADEVIKDVKRILK